MLEETTKQNATIATTTATLPAIAKVEGARDPDREGAAKVALMTDATEEPLNADPTLDLGHPGETTAVAMTSDAEAGTIVALTAAKGLAASTDATLSTTALKTVVGNPQTRRVAPTVSPQALTKKVLAAQATQESTEAAMKSTPMTLVATNAKTFKMTSLSPMVRNKSDQIVPSSPINDHL